ncbi:hypothetical protein Tco_0942955 [Tanacetum coccineum]
MEEERGWIGGLEDWRKEEIGGGKPEVGGEGGRVGKGRRRRNSHLPYLRNQWREGRTTTMGRLDLRTSRIGEEPLNPRHTSALLLYYMTLR